MSFSVSAVPATAVDERAPPTPPTPRAPLPVGFTLGDYTIEAVLGMGGFGITYRARETVLGRPVAIKEYLPMEFATRDANGVDVHPTPSGLGPWREGSDESFYVWGLTRFLQEAQVLAQIHHFNVVRVHRFFEAHGTAYIVMDFEAGQTLRQRLADDGTLDETTLRALLKDLLSALKVIHASGYFHRDIKAENIYLRDADGSCVLLDFGAARALMENYTRGVTIMISRGYSPPEQYVAGDNRLGPWTDIYAVGAVLYRGMAGQVPPESTARLLDDELDELLVPLTSRYSSSLVEVVRRAMALKPQTRYGSAAALAEDLSQLDGRVQQEGIPTIPGASLAPDPLLGAIPTVNMDGATGLVDSDTVVSTPKPQTVAQEPYPPGSGAQRRSRAWGWGLGLVAAAASAAGIALFYQGNLMPPDKGAVPQVGDGPGTAATKEELPPVASLPGAPVEPVEDSPPPPPSAVPVTAAQVRAVFDALVTGPLESPPAPVPEPLPGLGNPRDAGPGEARPGPWALAPPEAVPAAAETTSEVEPSPIPALLERADDRLAHLRLTVPVGDSAFDYYGQVLALDPDNATAKEGLVAIADAYEQLALRALAADEFSQADLFIQRGLEVQPGYPPLLTLADRQRQVPRDSVTDAPASPVAFPAAAPSPQPVTERLISEGDRGLGYNK